MEGSSYLLVHRGWIDTDLPTYSLKNGRSEFRVETDPFFGAWHPPHVTYFQNRTCYEAKVAYHTNAFGMRDPERVLSVENPRAVVLGDSFVEGYGVPEGKRISDLLEKARGFEHLNFGVAGMGPAQELLLYQSLAKKFSHSEVMVGIFPRNDFMEDDYEVWKTRGRYRPFFVGKYPDYQLVYSGKKPGGESPSLRRHVTRFLREFSYTYTVVYTVLYYRQIGDFFRTKSQEGDSYAGYYDFNEEEWNRMRYALEKIHDDAEGRRMTVILIPSIQDFHRYGQKGNPPLSERMKEFGKQHGVGIVDLLPGLYESGNWEKYYHLPCDPHLNEAGDALAAQLILSALEAPKTSGVFKKNAP